MAFQQVEKAGAGFGERFVAEGFCEVVFEEVACETEAIEDFGVGHGALAEEALRKRQEFGGPFACTLCADGAAGTGRDIGEIIHVTGHSAAGEVEPKAKFLEQLELPAQVGEGKGGRVREQVHKCDGADVERVVRFAFRERETQQCRCRVEPCKRNAISQRRASRTNGLN